MASINEAFAAALKVEDFPKDRDVPLTIQSVEAMKIDGDPKLRLGFLETERDWIIGPMPARMVATLHGDDYDEWVGKRVTLYVDPSVTFGGKIVGGIRPRLNATPPAPQPAPAPAAPPPADDGADLPF
jgi:hypothetical protein